MKRNLRIVYMGTPEFAVEPLRVILESGYNIAAVITAPDKPAGRGQKISSSPVKEFALANELPLLQPVNLKAPIFIEELRDFAANLQIVVAFRMLPEVIWQMPEYGTINLHASLLPQYRGAAPINHAIMNGETETGLTTFFIEKAIDTGNILQYSKLSILPYDDAGTLHDRLMLAGGSLMLKTLKMIESGEVIETSQEIIAKDQINLRPAPKIFKNDCRIDWSDNCEKIFNLIRGLAPYPGAYTFLTKGNIMLKQVKIFKATFDVFNHELSPGTIITDNSESLSVHTSNGLIRIWELQFEGKRRMKTNELLKGMNFTSDYRFE